MRQGKTKKEIEPMQRGDGSYRRAANCETAVNKGHHHNVAVR